MIKSHVMRKHSHYLNFNHIVIKFTTHYDKRVRLIRILFNSKSACSSMGLSTVATVFVPELGNITVTPMPVRANNDWSFPYRTHCCDKRMWFVEGNECNASCILACGQSTYCKMRCGSTCVFGELKAQHQNRVKIQLFVSCCFVFLF